MGDVFCGLKASRMRVRGIPGPQLRERGTGGTRSGERAIIFSGPQNREDEVRGSRCQSRDLDLAPHEAFKRSWSRRSGKCAGPGAPARHHAWPLRRFSVVVFA